MMWETEHLKAECIQCLSIICHSVLIWSMLKMKADRICCVDEKMKRCWGAFSLSLSLSLLRTLSPPFLPIERSRRCARGARGVRHGWWKREQQGRLYHVREREGEWRGISTHTYSQFLTTLTLLTPIHTDIKPLDMFPFTLYICMDLINTNII